MKRLAHLLILIFLFVWFSGDLRCHAAAAQPIITLEVQTKNHLGNTTKLMNLINGVGYEFDPQAGVAGKLAEIGIKRIRLIGVDIYTKIVDGQLKAPVLDKKLAWCRQHNFIPHIIIGQLIPQWLSTHGNDAHYGPKDYRAYEDYLRIFFKYVIFQKGFANATWEVGNEPDCGGAPVLRYPRSQKATSEEDYQSYLGVYRCVSDVAQQLEKEHPGIKIFLGGLASCGPVSFPPTISKFNWYERFLRDVAQLGLKLDFFSFHYYGNQSQLGRRPNLTGKPPFEEIMGQLYHWISLYKPHTPIWITEWGYSWLIHDNPPAALLNGTNVGAAWSAAFIDAMFRSQVDESFLLCCNDKVDNWAWPALFHLGEPKPIYYVYRMFHQLNGQLLGVQGGSVNMGALAAKDSNVLRVILWNYGWQRGRLDIGQEKAIKERISLLISQLPEKPDKYQINLSQISDNYGNPYFKNTSDKKEIMKPLQQDLGVKTCRNGTINCELFVPPSSVTLLEIKPVP